MVTFDTSTNRSNLALATSTAAKVRGWIILAVLAAAAGAFFYWNHLQSEKKARADAAALAVSVLPPGTEAAWDAYVDQQFAQAIQLNGDTVRVHDATTDALTTSTLVSRNSPYTVECDPIAGGSIDFGEGDSATSVDIFGTMASGQQSPPLGVPVNSVAARHLAEAMCDRIAAHMHDIMTRPAA